MNTKTGCVPSRSQLADFFTAQLDEWPEAAGRYRRLDEAVRRRYLDVGGFTMLLNFNADRAVSTCARLDAAGIAARPCFLCAANRPPQERSLPLDGGKWELLVNPYPIFSPHFIVASATHRPQLVDGEALGLMARMAQAWPDLAIFYNGPRSGASAPDHLHLQCVPAVGLPLLQQVDGSELKLLRRFGEAAVCMLPAHPSKPVALFAPDAEALVQTLLTVVGALPLRNGAGEPDFNIFAARLPRRGLAMVLTPREKHRPASFGPEGVMFSPGAADMAGCAILPREHDFDTLDGDRLHALYREVALNDTDFNRFILDIISHE